MLKRILRNEQGEGYIDTCVLVLCAVLVIAFRSRRKTGGACFSLKTQQNILLYRFGTRR